ncbi:universal stress protein [Bacillus sinesaloumensis]|uniref:universal stress protein n=1 Tax=Litchfieldia sinesaloumensis TaxID=1926280 RepID=UPI000988732B|nr:universal stress protein [Bacillus sinesaloumensis]
MYNKILLATDGSEHSRRAAEHAVMLASGNSHTTIVIVYVVDPNKVKSDILENWNGPDIGDKRRLRLRETERILKKTRASYEINILHGEPGPTIVNYANKNQFDLVIVGSRGLNVLQEFVLGSVSHKVAKRANCPVLIVK